LYLYPAIDGLHLTQGPIATQLLKMGDRGLCRIP
jgi:hypothetical protein